MTSDYYITIDGNTQYFDGFVAWGVSKIHAEMDTMALKEGQATIPTGLWVAEWQLTMEFNGDKDHGDGGGQHADGKFHYFMDFIEASGANKTFVTLVLKWRDGVCRTYEGSIGGIRAQSSAESVNTILVTMDFSRDDTA